MSQRSAGDVPASAPSLFGILRRYLLGGMGAVMLAGLVYWVFVIYLDRESRLETVRSELTVLKQAAVRQRLNDIQHYIRDQQGLVDVRLRADIRARTEEGAAVVRGLVGSASGVPLTMLRQRVREALRPVRYNKGRGYFFAFRLDGIEELLPIRPELEGKDMLPLRDPDGRFVVRDMIALARSQGEGFYEYRWSKPGTPGNDHRKIAYVKLLPELGWVIGTGEYLSDVEADVRAEVLAYIRRQDDSETRAFAGEIEEGTLLVAPGGDEAGAAQGGLALPLADLAARLGEGGGVIAYDHQGGRWWASVAPMQPWGWYLGVAYDQTEVDRQIDARRAGIDAHLNGSLFVFAFVFVLGAGLLYVAYGRLRRRAESGFATLRAHFEQAEQQSQPVDPAGLRYAELRELAEAMNRMVKQRADAEADLAAQHLLLEHLAFHDALTGLPNRTVVIERLNEALDLHRRDGGMGAVLFLDLDGFKVINDTLGHAVGDRFLVAIGERLASEIDDGDTLARLGGDEFVVVRPVVDSVDTLSALAGRLLLACQQPVVVDGMDLVATASIGIALSPVDGDHVDSLLSNADAAMYRVKQEGRNRFGFYTRELTEQAFARLNLVAQIRQAVERQEFIVYYQPKVSLHDDCIIGAEALVRWQHPARGLISPGEFIAIAEDAGHISAIGWSVLETVCRDLPALLAAFGPAFAVSVNLSKRQLLEGDFEARFLALIEAAGCHPSSLVLELTESAVAHDLERVQQVLNELEGRGFVVSLDDFGTGFSSLSYLKQLPVSELKIDRAFVQEIERDVDDVSIASAILALGHSMEMSVVAEGVETAAQAGLLREVGCEIAQGYLYGRPEPLADFLSRAR